MRCSVCGGEGGFWDTLDGRPPIGVWEEPPDFYWIECPHCLGTGREPPPKVRKERRFGRGIRNGEVGPQDSA